VEGIDHALVRHSSERPREDHDVERRVRQSKRLRGSLAELDVRKALAASLDSAAGERPAVGIDREHRGRVASRAQREPAFPRTDIGDAESPKVEAVGAQLDLGRRPEIPKPAR